MINGEQVLFTAEEETARDIIDDAFDATKLPTAKTSRKADATALCATKTNANLTHGGKTFDAGTIAQGQISFAVAYGQLNAVADVTTRNWTLADNTTVSVTWGALRAMATALFERNDAYHANLQTHKDAIQAIADGAGTDAEKIASIEAYDITTGW